MSANIPIDQILSSIKANFPDWDNSRCGNELFTLLNLCGVEGESSAITSSQHEKALALIDLVKDGKANDFQAANSLYTGDVVNIPVDSSGDVPVTSLDQEASEQATRIAELVDLANNGQQEEFRAGYDQLVLSKLPEALAKVRAEKKQSPAPSVTRYPGGGLFARALGLPSSSGSGAPAALPESTDSPK